MKRHLPIASVNRCCQNEMNAAQNEKITTTAIE